MLRKDKIQRDPLTAQDIASEIKSQLEAIRKAAHNLDGTKEHFARGAARFWARTLQDNYTPSEIRRSGIKQRHLNILSRS